MLICLHAANVAIIVAHTALQLLKALDSCVALCLYLLRLLNGAEQGWTGCYQEVQHAAHAAQSHRLACCAAMASGIFCLEWAGLT